MASSSYNSGDILIKYLYLSSLDGDKTIDFREQVEDMDIYESILSPIITGSMTINDSVKIRESFPIIGGKCKIKIEFVTPAPGIQSRTAEFVVTEVSNSIIKSDSQINKYVLSLASVEILENAKAQFKAPLIGNTIDDYVDIILKNVLNTKKNILRDPYGTKGQQRMDVVTMKPFQALDMLKQMAVSKAYKSNVYVFFENRVGFNFIPVEYLISAGVKLIKDAVFFFDSDVQTDAKNISFRTILAYNHLVQEAPAQALAEGALNNKTTQIDLKTRTKQVTEFNIAKNKDDLQFSKGARTTNKASYEAEYSKLPATTFNVIRSSILPESYDFEKMGYAKAFITMLTQNILRIMVWGDSYLTAGFRVRVEAPAPAGITKEGGKPQNAKSEFVSGEYLISHLRHSISKVNTGYRYLMSMELVNVAFGKTGVFES